MQPVCLLHDCKVPNVGESTVVASLLLVQRNVDFFFFFFFFGTMEYAFKRTRCTSFLREKAEQHAQNLFLSRLYLCVCSRLCLCPLDKI